MNLEYGQFGGQFVPHPLKQALNELETAFNDAIKDPEFIKEYHYYLKDYVGRPSPLYYAEQLTKTLGGGKIYLKREDLNHTGAHKINNTIGQILLAKRMGKKKIIAETGAGQHGVATATAAAIRNCLNSTSGCAAVCGCATGNSGSDREPEGGTCWPLASRKRMSADRRETGFAHVKQRAQRRGNASSGDAVVTCREPLATKLTK